MTACRPLGVCLNPGAGFRQRRRAAFRAIPDRLRRERTFALASPPDLPAACLAVILLSIHQNIRRAAVARDISAALLCSVGD